MPRSEGTFDTSVNLSEDTGRHLFVKRRALYATTTAALVLLLGLAMLDGLGAADIFGVDTTTERSSGAGYDLDVRYATASRPGLSTPFDITVTRTGGFDGPVTVAVSSDYLAIFDENGVDPGPSMSTSDGGRLIRTFDPPAVGDTLTIAFDARIDPSIQSSASGRVAVLDDDYQELVAVTVSTRILP